MKTILALKQKTQILIKKYKIRLKVLTKIIRSLSIVKHELVELKLLPLTKI